MKKLSCLLPSLLLMGLLGFSPATHAQDTLGEGPDFKREDGFLPLSAHFGSVLYPPSYLDRASHLMDRIELTGIELYRWSTLAVKVELLVLDLAGWQQRFPDRLYGLPTRVSPVSVAVAAMGTPGTVRVWAMLLGRPVPPAPGRPILGTPEEATTLVLCDLLLQLEMGKIFAEQAGYAEGAERWPADVMGHLAAVSFLKKNDAGQLLVFDNLFKTWGQDLGPHPLASKNDSLPLTKQLWYEARFREAANLILVEDGNHAISRIQRKMGKRKEREPAEVLIDLYPELTGWLEASFGPKTSN